jgi:glyceraldehyde-3-phosphate dehydrogenase (NAD(P))
MRRVRVAVNGYGVIGKRVADAVHGQEDMELAGICDIAADYRIRVPWGLGIPVFAPSKEAAEQMRTTGVSPQGSLDDLLNSVQVVVDCTPKKVAATNIPKYNEHKIKFILQGGETHETTGHSFVAQANYASALGRGSTRVVSCNTTATVRVLGALQNAGLLKRARGTLLRRATDPWESHLGGIINTIVPEEDIPSHQGPDAKTVLPELDVVTMACKVPETLGHVHYWWIELIRESAAEEVLEIFRKTPRVVLLHASEGLGTPNAIKEMLGDFRRPRTDLWEVVLWQDILNVSRSELFLCSFVDNQAIVIPETIDAIRALTELEPTAEASMAKTDRSLTDLSAGPMSIFKREMKHGECCPPEERQG